MEQNAAIPARGGLHGFFPGQGSSSSSRLHGGTDSREEKSAEEGPHSGSELGADFTPWTPAAYDAPIAAGSWSVEELEELAIWVDEFGPGRRSSRGGGSCTTPLMARSGGMSRARTCPSACNDGGKVEVDVPVVQVVDVGAVQLLDKVAVP